MSRGVEFNLAALFVFVAMNLPITILAQDTLPQVQFECLFNGETQINEPFVDSPCSFDNMLPVENLEVAKQMRFGLALAQKDYQQAQIILNQFDTTTTDSQYLKYTQQVVLEMNLLPWDTPLTAVQLNNLNIIANSEKSSKVYARGILALKIGAEWTDELPQPESSIEPRSTDDASPDSIEKQWKLSPNPTQSVLKLSRHNTTKLARIVILDAGNNILQRIQMEVGVSEAELQVSQLSVGNYFIQFEEQGSAPVLMKFVKN